MPFARIARLLANSLAISIGLVCALFLAWLAINLFDVPLTPAARAMLASPRDPYPEDENLYVAMAGFDAPSGRSMIETGLSRIRTLHRTAERLRADPALAPELPGKAQRDRIEVNGDTKDWQAVTDFPWRGAKARSGTLVALLKANRQLYRRYLALHGLHGYFDTVQPGDPYVSAYVPAPIQRLFLAETARVIQTGTPAERQAALAGLGRDLRMWRAVLDGGGGLMSKMLASDALNVDFHFLGDMVTDPECDLTFLHGRGQVILRPFALRDWKIGDAYRWEMRHKAAMFDALAVEHHGALEPNTGPAPWQWLESEWNGVQVQFFKPRATENLAAEQASRLSALADGNPATFLQRQAVFRKWSRRHVWIHYPTLYNPLGSAILAFRPPDPADVYAARVYDVAAFQRLVYLAYLIRKRGVAFHDVAEFIRQHPRLATHPVGGRPFRWNPATGRLAVAPVATHAAGAALGLRLTPPGPSGKQASRRPRLCHGPN